MTKKVDPRSTKLTVEDETPNSLEDKAKKGDNTVFT